MHLPFFQGTEKKNGGKNGGLRIHTPLQEKWMVPVWPVPARSSISRTVKGTFDLLVGHPEEKNVSQVVA